MDYDFDIMDLIMKRNDSVPFETPVPERKVGNININILFQNSSQSYFYTFTDIDMDEDGQFSLHQITKLLKDNGVIDNNSNLYFMRFLDGNTTLYHFYGKSFDIPTVWLPSTSIFAGEDGSQIAYLKVQSIAQTEQAPLNSLICNSDQELLQLAKPAEEEKVYDSLETTEVASQSLYQPIVHFEAEESERSSTRADNRSNRHTERTVNEVIELVTRWRKMHRDAKASGKKLNLEDCARIVGVPRKSLDDYSGKLKKAKNLGFDFKKHVNNGFGYLRQFVSRNAEKLLSLESDDE